MDQSVPWAEMMPARWRVKALWRFSCRPVENRLDGPRRLRELRERMLINPLKAFLFVAGGRRGSGHGLCLRCPRSLSRPHPAGKRGGGFARQSTGRPKRGPQRRTRTGGGKCRRFAVGGRRQAAPRRRSRRRPGQGRRGGAEVRHPARRTGWFDRGGGQGRAQIDGRHRRRRQCARLDQGRRRRRFRHRARPAAGAGRPRTGAARHRRGQGGGHVGGDGGGLGAGNQGWPGARPG